MGAFVGLHMQLQPGGQQPAAAPPPLASAAACCAVAVQVVARGVVQHPTSALSGIRLDSRVQRLLASLGRGGG
jgi:hypothetical protein